MTRRRPRRAWRPRARRSRGGAPRADDPGEQVGDDGSRDRGHGHDGDGLAPVGVGGDDRRRARCDDDEAAERREQREDEALTARPPDELTEEREDDAERHRGRDPEQVLTQRASTIATEATPSTTVVAAGVHDR